MKLANLILLFVRIIKFAW